MNQKAVIVLLLMSLLSGCNTLKPIKTEFNLIKTFSSTVRVSDYGNGKILIYNGAGFWHKSDNSSTLNIWINGRALGQIRLYEYAIFYLLPDKYEFRITHKDIANFESSHTIIIDNKTSVINIKPTTTSNKVEITNEIPLGFDNYRNILQ